jgi:hypothetical protein
MRLDRDRLIFLALLVLDEACDECREGPLKPSFSIRLALAFLYAHGSGDKTLFEEFWQEIRREDYSNATATQVAYLRPTYARTKFTAIARSVGVELSLDVMERLHKARRRVPSVPSHKL